MAGLILAPSVHSREAGVAEALGGEGSGQQNRAALPDLTAAPGRLSDVGWTCDTPPPDAGPPFVIVDTKVTPAPHHAGSLYQAIARLHADGPRTIFLRTGAYRLSEPLVLTAADQDLTIAACPGETPVLTTSGDGPILKLQRTSAVTLSGLIFDSASPAQLLLESARDCVIASNTFLHGRVGILLVQSSENRIQRNLVVSAASSGIELRDRSDGNLLTDNIVDGTDAVDTHGGGIFLHGANFNRIAHNLVRNTAGFGIGVLNWDETTLNTGNTVEFNVLRDTALRSEDSGAIYVLGRAAIDTKMVIASNVIDGVGSAGYHTIGVYLDDSTSGVLVTGNLIRRPGKYAVQIHGGSDNTVESNLLDLGHGQAIAVLFQAAPADTRSSSMQTGNAVVRNIILSAVHDPKLFDWLDGGSPRIADNVYANATGAAPARADSAETRFIIVDPLIARDAGRDGYASIQAVAARIGFRPINEELAGPRSRTGVRP